MHHQKITVDELIQTMNGQSAPTIIDVRSPGEYSQGHLPNAINIPAAHLEGMLTDLPDSEQIVVYCNMSHPGNASSERAAEVLNQHGYNARALEGGFPGWEGAGHEVDYVEHSYSQDASTRRNDNRSNNR